MGEKKVKNVDFLQIFKIAFFLICRKYITIKYTGMLNTLLPFLTYRVRRKLKLNISTKAAGNTSDSSA